VISLGACAVRSQPWASEPAPVDVAAPPPLRIMRVPPDFRLRDYGEEREYLIRRYSDSSRKEIIVTILEPGRPERLATAEEHAHAWNLFESEWAGKPRDARLDYFRGLRELELSRNATLVDEEIRLQREALARLEEERRGLDADLRARRETAGYTAEAAKKLDVTSSGFLEGEIARRDLDLHLARTRLEILQYKRRLLATPDTYFGTTPP
jgi:hypothetical protein